MQFRDKVALVTGATRGIGKAVAEKLVAEGARVVGVYHSESGVAASLTREYQEKGYFLKLLQGNVKDKSFVDRAIGQIVQDYGAIDILVNNAGIARDGFLASMNGEEWQEVLEVNFLGTLNCCLGALSYMLRQGSGRVVNLVSVSGTTGAAGQTNYSCSKGAILGLTRLLARKYSALGIYFNALAPGFIETDMLDKVPEETLAISIKNTNLKRLGTPEEIAEVVAFLCSNNAGYINNSVLTADGGLGR